MIGREFFYAEQGDPEENALIRIYFAGKEVYTAHPGEYFATREFEFGGEPFDYKHEAEETNYHLNFLNDILKAITDKHLDKEEAMERIRAVLSEDGEEDTWQEYFRRRTCFDVRSDEAYYKLKEELLPDIKALFEEGKLIINNELVAEAGKGYIE